MIRTLAIRLLDKIMYLYRINLINKDERMVYTSLIKSAIASHNSGDLIAIREDLKRKATDDTPPLLEVLSLFNEYRLET